MFYYSLLLLMWETSKSNPDCLSSCENLTLAHALFACKVYIAIKKTWLHWHATKRALITPVDWWLIQSQYGLMEWHSGFFPEQHNLFYFTLSFLVELITTTQLISIPYPISHYPHFACVWLHFNLHTAGILFNQLAATVGRQRLSLGWAWRPARLYVSVELALSGLLSDALLDATCIHAGWLLHCCPLIWLAGRKQQDYIIHATTPFVLSLNWEGVITTVDLQRLHALTWTPERCGLHLSVVQPQTK